MVRMLLLLRSPYAQVIVLLAVAVFCLILLLSGRRDEEHISIVPPRPPQDATAVMKALVIAKTREEDTDWLFNGGFNESIALYIYTMSDRPEPGYLLPHTTQGREAAAFVSYIIDYYDVLPKYSIFIHGGDKQRHNDLLYLNSRLLPHLRTAAIDAHGYVNLRCDTDPGCPIAVNPHDFTKEDLSKKLDPRAKFAEIYAELFNVSVAEVPRHIGGVCCAQFAVHRERIRQRPKTDYVRMMHWMATTSETDSFGVGWVMEKLWHVVFGMESIQ